MIVGHQKILHYLQKSFDAGNFSHAYIFFGPSKLGKKTLATEWIRQRYCFDSSDTNGECANCKAVLGYTHPDFFVIDPERADKKEIGIEEIRDLKAKLILTPYGDVATTFILINDAERLTHEAVSALLKTLEEPRPNTYFILITANLGGIPETIRSRAHTLSFFPVSEDMISKHLIETCLSREEEARRFARLSFGRPGVAIDMVRLGEQHPLTRYRRILNAVIGGGYEERFMEIERLMSESERPVDFLDSLTIFIRDAMMARIGCEDLTVYEEQFITETITPRYTKTHLVKLLRYIEKVKYACMTTNINSRLALEALILEF